MHIFGQRQDPFAIGALLSGGVIHRITLTEQRGDLVAARCAGVVDRESAARLDGGLTAARNIGFKVETAAACVVVDQRKLDLVVPASGRPGDPSEASAALKRLGFSALGGG